MASEESPHGQIIKRYQLFDEEKYEEKLMKKPKDSDIAAKEDSKLEPAVKMSAVNTSQGLAVINDIWYILGSVKPFQPEFNTEQNMLLVVSKGVTLAAVHCHLKSFGIWSREAAGNKWIITVGEDLVNPAMINSGKKGMAPGSEEKVKTIVLKIWDAEALLEGKYRSLSEYEKFESPLQMPLIVYLDQIVPIEFVYSFDISKDMTHAVIGLDKGSIILMKIDPKVIKSQSVTNPKDVQYMTLNNDQLPKDPITNLYIYEKLEKGKSMYQVYCTTHQAFFVYNLTEKKGIFSLIGPNIGANKREMNGIEGTLAILNSSEPELRKYQAESLQGAWPMKDKGAIRLVGKEVMIVVSTERNKTIRVYDLETEIISYQAVVAEILAEYVQGSTIYLLLKTPTSRITQTLREKTNIDKLEAFLRKKHYDVAYKFAKNEKFSEEVLADISRYYGDFHHSKGMYKEAVENYKSTIGFLNPSYVIQKFLDVQRLENLTDYLEELSRTSQEKDTMMEEHKYYTALLLNCYVKQGGDKLKNLIASASFDKNILDTDTAIEVCKESKKIDCALLLAQKAGNMDQQLRILIEDLKMHSDALEIIDKNISNFQDKLTYLRRFGPQLIKKLPDQTYDAIEKVGQILIDKRSTDTANAQKYTQQFKWLKEIFVDNADLNKKFLDFQINKDPNCEKEVYHSLIEWHLQDYHNAKKREEETKMDLPTKSKDPLIMKKRKHLLDLLQVHKERYDKKHVLMLFEMYQVSEGVKVLCEMLELKHELMTYFMQNGHYESIEALCKQYGAREQNLWIQALTYFVNEIGTPGSGEASKYIQSILKSLQDIPSISPLLVLEIVSKNKEIKIGVLKDYLANRLKKLQKNIEKNRKVVEHTGEEIDKVKDSIKTLRTTAQLFQLKECSECGKKLELPIYHFMCNHSFHEYCVSTEAAIKECPKCCVQAQQVLDKKAQLEGQVDNHEQFFKELKENDKKFDVIATYFGRGLFSEVAKPHEEQEEEKEEPDE